jgi:hypothetical protein
MTRRDLRWRMAGALLIVGGCAQPLLSTDGSAWVLVHFLAAIAGLVLMVNGKRLAVFFQAERRGHCDTPAAVHAARLRRRR